MAHWSGGRKSAATLRDDDDDDDELGQQAALLAELEVKLVKLENMVRFISENIDLYMIEDAELFRKLEEKGYASFPTDNATSGYEYLICMPNGAKSLPGFQALVNARDKVQEEVRRASTVRGFQAMVDVRDKVQKAVDDLRIKMHICLTPEQNRC